MCGREALLLAILFCLCIEPGRVEDWQLMWKTIPVTWKRLTISSCWLLMAPVLQERARHPCLVIQALFNIQSSWRTLWPHAEDLTGRLRSRFFHLPFPKACVCTLLVTRSLVKRLEVAAPESMWSFFHMKFFQLEHFPFGFLHSRAVIVSLFRELQVLNFQDWEQGGTAHHWDCPTKLSMMWDIGADRSDVPISMNRLNCCTSCSPTSFFIAFGLHSFRRQWHFLFDKSIFSTSRSRRGCTTKRMRIYLGRFWVLHQFTFISFKN